MKDKAVFDQKRKYTFKTEPDESLRFYCNNCRSHTSHKTLMCVDTVDDDPESPVSFFGTYRITECSGCHSIRYVERSFSSEDDECWAREQTADFSCSIYPISEEGALTESRLSELQFVLPPRVKRIYEETLAAIKNKLFVVAGIGLRAVLDTVCRDKGIGTGRVSLAKRLEIMSEEKRLITPDEKEILDAVKGLGNGSAHEGKPLKSYEIHSALIVVEHILDKLYLLPKIKKEFEEGKETISFIDAIFEPQNEEK